MGQKRRKSVKHPKPPPAPSSSGGAEDSSPEEETPKTLTRTTKSRPAKPQPSNTKTPILALTSDSDSGSSDSESEFDFVSVSDSESEFESDSESKSNADEKEVGQQAAPTPVGATTKSVREKMGSSTSEATGTPVGKKLFQRILSDGADIGDFVMNNGLKLLGADKRAEMEDEWKKLKLEELNLYIRKLELLKKRSVLIAAALQD